MTTFGCQKVTFFLTFLDRFYIDFKGKTGRHFEQKVTGKVSQSGHFRAPLPPGGHKSFVFYDQRIPSCENRKDLVVLGVSWPGWSYPTPWVPPLPRHARWRVRQAGLAPRRAHPRGTNTFFLNTISKTSDRKTPRKTLKECGGLTVLYQKWWL